MNPFLIGGDVEVTDINTVLKTFSLVIHVKAAPLQMYTLDVESHISSRARWAMRYLVDEGFLPPPANDYWKCTISGICH